MNHYNKDYTKTRENKVDYIELDKKCNQYYNDPIFYASIIWQK